MKTKDFYKRIGQRLKELRLQANITQEELAEGVGVATKTVSYWENGHNPICWHACLVMLLYKRIKEWNYDKEIISFIFSNGLRWNESNLYGYHCI